MTQRYFAGASAVAARSAGAQLVRRRFRGSTLVWEHPDYPTLDFTPGVLPSPSSVPSAGLTQVTYARTGVAYAWQAGSPLPTLVQIAADTPRFSVCPPGVDGDATGDAMGILIEPAGQNLLPYGRGTATGWTSTNITAGTTTGIDGVSSAARTLTATAGSALHYRTTPPASQTAKWVFSAWVKRINGLGQVWLTLKSGVEIDISAALANFYIDGSNNHQYAWARVYVAIPGVGPWYGDINTCDRIGFRIDESGDAIACDALQLEIGDYPTSEILNGSSDLNTRAADRLLIDTNVGGAARRYLLDADEWAADASAPALLWRIRQERHIARIMVEPNGANWDIDLQTPPENRPNMGWHDGAPSSVLYSISQPEGIPIRDQVYASGYVIEGAAFGDVSLAPAYAPTAYAIASASSQRLRWRRTSGGLSTAGGTTEKKLSFCLLGESGADSASDEVYLGTTQQNVLVRLNGSDGKFQIRFGQAGTWPVIVNSAVAYSTPGLKWAMFGSWDCTGNTSSKVRVYIARIVAGVLTIETVVNNDALAHSSFAGTNLGGDATIFLGSTNGGASYANGKLGMLWWLADFIDWSNSAFRDALIEKSAADVLQAKNLDTAAAANAVVNGLSPEIWLALNANEQLGSPYNRGSLGVANVLTYADNAPAFGAWA